jgi:hypothetical protein
LKKDTPESKREQWMVLDIEKMSLEEKLQAMEELWEDLRVHYEKKTPPQRHR